MRNYAMFFMVALTFFASACGMSESKYADRMCDKAIDCFGELATCADEDEVAEETESCDYDAKKAKQCADEYEQLACAELLAPPAVCAEVYTNCG